MEVLVLRMQRKGARGTYFLRGGLRRKPATGGEITPAFVLLESDDGR